MVSRSTKSAPMLSGCHGFPRQVCQLFKYLRIGTACLLTLEGRKDEIAKAEEATGTRDGTSGLRKDYSERISSSTLHFHPHRGNFKHSEGLTDSIFKDD